MVSLLSVLLPIQPTSISFHFYPTSQLLPLLSSWPLPCSEPSLFLIFSATSFSLGSLPSLFTIHFPQSNYSHSPKTHVRSYQFLVKSLHRLPMALRLQSKLLTVICTLGKIWLLLSSPTQFSHHSPPSSLLALFSVLWILQALSL